MLFFAGHGMQKDGLQVIVVNEFDKQNCFYKLYQAEMWIRKLSDEFNNCYFVSLFACCREIFRFNKHTNCISLQDR